MLSIGMDNPHPDLLKRYVNGKCTNEEKATVEYWLEHGDLQPEIELPEDRQLEYEIWAGIVEQAKSGYPRFRFRRFRQLAVAASLLILTGLFLIYNARSSKQVTALKTLHVPIGQQLMLTLSDQSTVELSGGSSIQYPESFKGEKREVTLIEGEAFFSVTHHPEQPFLVRTSKTSICVLGTKFNVENATGSDRMFVTLTQGSIRFQGDNLKPALLQPGQQLVFMKKQQMVSSITQIDTNIVTSWRTGVLWFDRTPVSVVLQKLERHYGVKFNCPEGIKLDDPVTAKFHEQSLSRVLRLMENFTNLKFQLKDKQVNIYTLMP